MSEQSRLPSSVLPLVVVIVLSCLAVGLLATPALAGDGATIFEVHPDEVDADAGETITVDIIVNEHGDLHANGIDALSFDLEYDADVLTATEVEHGSMLAAGDDDATVDGMTDIDDDAGVVTVSQQREPSGDGARGRESAATVTFEIDDDAEPASEPLEIVDASATLVSSDYPQTAVEFDGTVHVEGGDETDDGESGDGVDDVPDGVTIADDADIDSSADDGGGGQTESAGEDPVPGFAVGAAVVTLLATLLVIASRRFQ
ncbi:cohesin domain-containing protein [Salinadaptatus halalkaliphilus]|uniref:Cohesin domain-containing protein n=1 Tax=Salinadaptatus halalkaliphilus TaxID=2419781 RepID=A0A4S3TP42_9EURY|nr:cohesin domain-containing protein [Salinadaptatus halalkaliphilus]THE64993.1 cohesin domain-containing protein [Salinadaptatus halalkaliphilus]